MEKKTKTVKPVENPDAKKDAALAESFAEIKKAATEKNGKAVEETPAKKTASKKAPAVKKTAEAKKPEEKPAEEKKAVPVKKTAAKKTAAKKPEARVTFEFNGKQIDVQAVLDKAVEAAVQARPDTKSVDVYVVANQNAAYYVVDGEGKEEYRIDL